MRFEAEKNGEVLVLHVRVAKDEELKHLGNLKSEVTRHVAGGETHITVDLTELDFIDSKGMGVLVGCARLVEEKGGSFLVFGMGLRLAETLHIVRLNQVIPFRLTRDEAINDARNGTEGGLAALIEGNPTLSEVRDWWSDHGGSIASARPSQVPVSEMSKRQPEHKETRFLSDWPSPDIARLQNLIEGNHNLQDWMQALYLFSEAKRLSQRYEIPFNAEMSFKEFLSHLADSLSMPAEIRDSAADNGENEPD